ncbi:guanine deaminase [Georgenia alba]|uniref:Guanine deaminase n=1 Tax=Georgenia alba TaxID=2233858 RepID=A0ABW2QCB4_9MICO
MTVYLATVLDTPGETMLEPRLRAASGIALVVEDGTVVARTDRADARTRFPDHDVVDLTEGVLLPGLVDTHVHYPQVRVVGGVGLPLLDWLRERALPEEARLAEPGYAARVATEFLTGLAGAGTTTALVFGSHFAGAMDQFFPAAAASGLRITAGLVLSDVTLPEELLTTPQRAVEESVALATRWHGSGRLRYAVTPRFALSAGEAMLDACAAVVDAVDGVWVTSHLNENRDEVAQVRELFGVPGYLDAYDRHGLVTRRSVWAHDVHPTAAELARLAETGTAVAHCPTSNAALGSGIFPMRDHLAAGVSLALGSDVGAGTGFCLLKEALQACLLQHLHPEGAELGPAALLHLATRSGAQALGLADTVGDLSVGKAFDAVWVRPARDSTLDVALRHAADPADALARTITLGGPADVARTWVAGEAVTASRRTELENA